MNWVRINTTLPDSPKLIALARRLDCSMNEALGVAVRWLCWLDSHTADGKSGLYAPEVDDVVCQKESASTALCEIGWAYKNEDDFICAVDYETYNTPNTKAKTLAAARQKKSRLNKKHK